MSSRSLMRRDAQWVNTGAGGRAANAKAASGMGVVHMTYEPPLENFRETPQALMKRFLKAYRVTWFYKAESAISFDVSNLEVQLKKADGTEIELPDKRKTFESLNPIEKCRRLLDQPNSEQSWRQFIEKTQIRADMAGNALWYLDEMDEVLGTPTQLWNVNPSRMWPQTKGNKVIGWIMDKDDRGGGVPFQSDEIAHLAYGSADDQVWGVGVVEAVLYEWEVSQLMSKHISDVLTLGGRLAGMITPKERSLTEDEFQDTLRAWRSIENSGNAARRLLVFPEPMDWTRGSATPQEIGLPGLSEINRTNILSAFPISEMRLGVPQASGINSGDTRKHMFKEYWEFTIHPRVAILEEFAQKYIVDPYALAAGEELKIEIQETHRDDAATMLEKAAAFRALLNLGFDPESIIPAVGLDRIKWDPELLEQMIMQAFLGATEASGQAGAAQQVPGMGADQHVNGGVNGTRSPSKQARNNAGNTRSGANSLQKNGIRLPNPLMAGDVGQRIMVNDANRKDNVTVSQVLTTQRKAARVPGAGGREVLPSIESRASGSLNSFFTEQRNRIIGNVKSNWPKTKAARKSFPENEYWTEEIEDEALKKSIKEFIASASIAALQNVADDMERILDSRATRTAMDASWELAAMDITKINVATRDAIRALLEEGGKRGYSVNQIVDGVIDEGFTGLQDLLLANGNAAWGDARAEAIARTELNETYNRSNLLGYQALGVREVLASDGDLDEECRDRDGQTYSIEEALTIRDHPNGTLDWSPQVPEYQNKADPDVPTMPFYQVLETTPPNINVTSPTVNVTTPDINVNSEPAQVIFQPGAFVIEMPPQRAVRKIVERDKDNRVTGITEVPDGPES